jgi:putative GTP pyrophosphokinase
MHIDEPEITSAVNRLAELAQPLAEANGDDFKTLRLGLQKFMLEYEFGLQEVETKIDILRQEFQHVHDYNPIEHVATRIKSPESLATKIRSRNLAPDLPEIRKNITDIAGARVVCSFKRDTYRIFDLLSRQNDIEVLEVKDYIANPKPNGYSSLHAIVQVPIFLSTGPTPVTVEIQFRTIAMDFWAALEHKIHYKFDGDVPEDITEELTRAAHLAGSLDSTMQALDERVHGRRE